MEHTKGEWERHNRLYGDVVTEHLWCGNKHIADFDGENATANAKLCVVAPKLLAWLKWCRDHLLTRTNDPDNANLEINGVGLREIIAEVEDK